MGKRSNHRADIKNPNRGTPGTNRAWDHAQGNRGKQMNPNWTAPKPRDEGRQGAPQGGAQGGAQGNARK
jgi:hypothetical protein